MVAFKAGDSARIARSPKPSIAGYLVYGNDPSHISEIARELADALSRQTSPAGEIVRISEQDAAGAPGRIAMELQTLPMFGGRPVIWVRSGSAAVLAEIEDVLATGKIASALVVEAGNLARGARLRQLFEQRPDLAALPCYGDDIGGVSAMITRKVGDAGVRLAPEALAYLKDRLGTDLAVARQQMEKLLLYAHGESCITAEMAAEAIDDGGQSAVDELIGAAFAGDTRSIATHLDNLDANGATMQSILALLQLHLLRLIRVKAAVEAGSTAEAAMRQLRPPIHFRIEKRFHTELRRHSLTTLLEIEARLLETVRASRLSASLDRHIVERFLISVAQAGQKSPGEETALSNY